MNSLIFNVSEIDTTPGASLVSPFSPPLGWEGGSQEYLLLMKRRYKEVDGYQRCHCAAHFARRETITFRGPFAKEAQHVIAGINRNRVTL